jgi:eukaryotic-like serine/threonine-protein kinase
VVKPGVIRRAEARVGAVLRDKWRLERLIGVGGMAAVYAATHRNGSRVAIKMLRLELCADEEIKRRFLQEGYAANAVGHPGAVRVLDDDETEDGSVFLVMDLLEGESLGACAARSGGKLPPQDVLRYTDQLLDILAAAHEKGIIHRDIKPDNVFLSRMGSIYLLDFGIARLRSGGLGMDATAVGATFGTPAFMSPEQALGKMDEVDAQSDLWASGATAFMLIAGRTVHPSKSLRDQLVANASQSAPSLATIEPRLPEQVVAIIDRCLAFKKGKRFPDARSVQHAIRCAQAELGWAPVPKAVSNPDPTEAAVLAGPSPRSNRSSIVPVGTVTDFVPSRRGRAAVLFAIGAGVTMLVVLLGFLLFQRGPESAAAPAASSLAAAAPVASSPVPTSRPEAPRSAAPAAGGSGTAAPLGVASASARAAPSGTTPSASAMRRPPVSATVQRQTKASSADDWLSKQH